MFIGPQVFELTGKEAVFFFQFFYQAIGDIIQRFLVGLILVLCHILFQACLELIDTF